MKLKSEISKRLNVCLRRLALKEKDFASHLLFSFLNSLHILFDNNLLGNLLKEAQSKNVAVIMVVNPVNDYVTKPKRKLFVAYIQENTCVVWTQCLV